MVVRPTSLKKTEPPAEPESSSTKERLLQVAQALFAQKGFHATSTREITRRANTNVASLYFHWRTKENLYLAVYRRLFQQLTQMRQGMIELLEEGLRTHSMSVPRRRLVMPAQGVEYTIVNGTVLCEHGKHTGALPGQVLRSGAA